MSRSLTDHLSPQHDRLRDYKVSDNEQYLSYVNTNAQEWFLAVSHARKVSRVRESPDIMLISVKLYGVLRKQI